MSVYKFNDTDSGLQALLCRNDYLKYSIASSEWKRVTNRTTWTGILLYSHEMLFYSGLHSKRSFYWIIFVNESRMRASMCKKSMLSLQPIEVKLTVKGIEKPESWELPNGGVLISNTR